MRGEVDLTYELARNVHFGVAYCMRLQGPGLRAGSTTLTGSPSLVVQEGRAGRGDQTTAAARLSVSPYTAHVVSSGSPIRGERALLRIVQVALSGAVADQYGNHQTTVGVVENVAMKHPFAGPLVEVD